MNIEIKFKNQLGEEISQIILFTKEMLQDREMCRKIWNIVFEDFCEANSLVGHNG